MTEPYNAGQTIEVENVIAAPPAIVAIDCGKITITENWGRLFIKHGDTGIVVQTGAYPALRDAIAHFIEPHPDPRDEVIARLVEGVVTAYERKREIQSQWDTKKANPASIDLAFVDLTCACVDASDNLQDALAALAAAKTVQK